MACEPGFDPNPMCWLQSGMQAVASSVVEAWADSIIAAVKTVLGVVGTFWVQIPFPEVAGTPAVTQLQQNLHWYALAAMVLGILLCAGRMALTSRGEHGLEAAKMLARVILVSGAAMAGVALANQAGDRFAEWVLEQALNADFDQSLSQAAAVAAMGSIAPALMIVLGLFMLLGAGLMVATLVLRWIAMVLLMGFWPVAAALSTTEQGQQWYRKINGWIIAFLLLKPVAAVIYAAGFLLLSGGGATPSDGAYASAMSVLAGMVCLAAAGLTLPALIKLVAPPAAGAAGPSGASAAGGMVATGAAVATLAGGGASAGAAAGGGSSSTGSNGPSGAATTAGTGPGTGGGGDSPTGGGGAGSSGGGGDSPTGGDRGGAGQSGSGTGAAAPSGDSGGSGSAGPGPSGSSGDTGRAVGQMASHSGSAAQGSANGDGEDESEGPTGAESGGRQ